MQLVRRATALTFLDLSYNPDLEFQVDDVGAVFMQLSRLRTLRMHRGDNESDKDHEWSLGSVQAVAKLFRECPGLDVSLGYM